MNINDYCDIISYAYYSMHMHNVRCSIWDHDEDEDSSYYDSIFTVDEDSSSSSSSPFIKKSTYILCTYVIKPPNYR